MAAAPAVHALSVDLVAEPAQVSRNGTTTLRWRSSDARWCYSRGQWGAKRGLWGSFETGPITERTWFGITCSDGNTEVSDSVTVTVRDGQTQPQPELSVNLTASPGEVGRNGSSTLSWTSTGARWCWSRGVWGSGRPREGSFNTGPLTSDTWYGITCSDGNNQVSDSVTVRVRAGGGGGTALSVDLRAEPQRVSEGQASRLVWSSEGADWCWAGGGWSGGRSLTGSASTGTLSDTTTYRLTCQRGSETAVSSVSVQVDSQASAPVVEWRAPTRNVDGSRINDLAGYNFYWGTRSRNYAGSARVNNPNWTQYRPDHLEPGRYFVAVTAVDADGNESSYSNEIQVTVE